MKLRYLLYALCYLAMIAAIILLCVSLVTRTNDQPGPQPGPQDTTTTVTVYVDSVFIMHPDTLDYFGQRWTINQADVFSARLGYWPAVDTFTFARIYHGYSMYRNTVGGAPCWRERSEPWCWGYLQTQPGGPIMPNMGTWGLLTMRWMTGAIPPDSGSATIVKETGGKP